ncbi:MAG: CDP-glycerol glycerophosphotransferase family protein [Tannerellaceae bacterium]|jgi:CDP-glycerol glycerophosphotransferase (TagB/SpsB family)|nr:CDP-glycerol glycerophosphotransferase family protein [Tannerellaceae bacterium]
MKSEKWIEYIKFCLKLIGYLTYHMSKALPRNKNKWCFDDLQGLGNSRFLYIDVLENHSELKPVCITKDKSYRDLRRQGFTAYHWLSLAGIYHCMTAGVYIVTINMRQINPYLSGGACYVNLWHGNGLKACIWNSEKNAVAAFGKSLDQIARSSYCTISLFYTYFLKPDVALSSSSFLTKNLFSPQFRIPENRFIETNFPRNAIFFWSRERQLDFIRKYESGMMLELIQHISGFKKTYIYMPTWRESKSDIITRSGMDFSRLNEALRSNNELFILKLHPLERLDLEEVSGYSNLKIMERRDDVYAILPFTDVLITDYSSIYYDYLQMNKEIIIFCFDLEKYTAEIRELMFDYVEYMPGVRVERFDELLSLIRQHTDCHVKDRDRIMKLFWESYDNGLDLVQAIKERQHKTA